MKYLEVLDTGGVRIGPRGPCDEYREDLDGSGAVDFRDLLIVLDSRGDC